MVFIPAGITRGLHSLRGDYRPCISRSVLYLISRLSHLIKCSHRTFILDSIFTEGLFNHFINQQDYQPRWVKIDPVNKDGSDHRPGQRGGHQMVMDPYTGESFSYFTFL